MHPLRWSTAFCQTSHAGCQTSILQTAAQSHLPLQLCLLQRMHPRPDGVRSVRGYAQTGVGLPQNGEHNGSGPCKQQGRNLVNLSQRANTETLEMVPREEHFSKSSACTRQIKHRGRLGIEGFQRQQRVENRPANNLSQTYLFAFLLNAQLPKEVSRHLDPKALHVDSLKMHWTTFKGYTFAPFNLIPAELSKVPCNKA